MSSTEAEYIALSDCSFQVVWVKTLLQEISFNLNAIPICGDNQGLIFIMSNPVTEKRSKYIDIRYHYICNIITVGHVKVYFIDGENNLADMFTKNLSHIKFNLFYPQLGLEFSPP